MTKVYKGTYPFHRGARCATESMSNKQGITASTLEDMTEECIRIAYLESGVNGLAIKDAVWSKLHELRQDGRASARKLGSRPPWLFDLSDDEIRECRNGRNAGFMRLCARCTCCDVGFSLYAKTEMLSKAIVDESTKNQRSCGDSRYQRPSIVKILESCCDEEGLAFKWGVWASHVVTMRHLAYFTRDAIPNRRIFDECPGCAAGPRVGRDWRRRGGLVA